MKFIVDYFKNRKTNKIRKDIQRLQTDAMHYQRNGNLRMLGYIMSEIQELEHKLLDLEDDED